MWVPGMGGSTDYIPTDLGRIGRTPTPKLSLGSLLPHPTTNGESSSVILKRLTKLNASTSTTQFNNNII